MRKLIIATVLAAISVSASYADGNCPTCPGGSGAKHGGHFQEPKTWGPHAKKYQRFTGWFHSSGNATPSVAPWYMYFPYSNSRVMTPGPVGGPPMGGGMVNPYFPQGN
jgi:hypothetical protein